MTFPLREPGPQRSSSYTSTTWSSWLFSRPFSPQTEKLRTAIYCTVVEPSRGHSLSFPVHAKMEASQLVHSSPNLSPSNPPLRKRNTIADLQCWDTPHIDLFCIPSQQPVTNLLFSPCQSSGLGNRRIEHQLEGDPGLCLPSNLSAPSCPRQKTDQEICKILLIAPFWPRQAWFPWLLDLPSPSTSGLAKAPQISWHNQSPKHLIQIQTVFIFLPGCYQNAIKMTPKWHSCSPGSKSKRASTRKTYDNRLQYYIKWCSQKAVNPYSASLTDIGDSSSTLLRACL